MANAASVFKCPELLRIIFQELTLGYLPVGRETLDSAIISQFEYENSREELRVLRRPARRDLASTARVCKAFSEHALDALWEVLDDEEPVVDLLELYRECGTSAESVCYRYQTCRPMNTTHHWTQGFQV